MYLHIFSEKMGHAGRTTGNGWLKDCKTNRQPGKR